MRLSRLLSKKKFHQRIILIVLFLTLLCWKILHISINCDAEERNYKLSNERLIRKVKLLESELNTQNEREKLSILSKSAAIDLRNTPYPGVRKYTEYAVARLGLVALRNMEQIKPEFGPVINDVLSFRFPITIKPCPNISINKSILIAVISATINFEQRKIIRQSWPIHLKTAYYKGLFGMARYVFILGSTADISVQSKINEESKNHEDIIQMNILDSYRNLTLKIVGLFNWVNSNCAKVNFIFKVDDDVYVNVHNLAQLVASQYNSHRSVFGHVWHVAHPNRDGKWKMTYEEWPWNQYPEYVNGPAYLLHGTAILPLLAACQTTPMIPFEDIYITGLCTEKAGVKKYFSTGRFRFFSISEILPTACELRFYISWLTDNHMDSHTMVDAFYNNHTQCITDSNGIKSIFDYTDPVQFYFN